MIEMIILIMIMLAACVFVVAEYLLWYKRAKAKVCNDEAFVPRKTRKFGLLEIYLDFYLICFGAGNLLDWLYIRNSRFCGFTCICLCVVILLLAAFYFCIKKENMGKWKWMPLMIALLIVCLNVGAGVYTAKNGTWWKYDEHEIPVSLEDLGLQERIHMTGRRTFLQPRGSVNGITVMVWKQKRKTQYLYIILFTPQRMKRYMMPY